MAGPNDKQNENIARAKLRQQQERERAAKAAAQKRARVTAAAVAALLVIGAGVAATQLIGGNDDNLTATDDPSADLVRDTVSPAPPGKENCRYAPEDSEDTGGKKVSLPPLIAEAEKPYTIKITTSKGPVELKLNSKEAPCTVNSFVHLARSKFYDGTECHRELLDDGYGILQCGDPTGKGNGGAGYSFNDENLEGAEYKKGTVAMANIGRVNTNGSQFFLVFRDSTFPPSYTPFGTIEGEESFKTLEAIAKDGVTTSDMGANDKPKKKVTIEKVTVEGPPPYEEGSATGEQATTEPGEEPSESPSPSAAASRSAGPSPSKSSKSSKE